MDHVDTPPLELLIRDPLTGAYTRGLLQDRFQEELARAEREISPLVVLYFDLDAFGELNDLHGRLRADEVLKETVRRAYQSIRLSDLLFRYESDAFVVLLPSTNRDQAVVVCQRFFEHLQENFEGEPVLEVTVSLGVASYPEDGDDPASLLDMARSRHDHARAAGGGQFFTHDEGDAPRMQFNPRARPIEREEHLQAFAGFLNALPAQRKGLFAVAGQKGSGRTFFLRHAALMAQDHQHLVLPLVPGAGTQPYPLGSPAFLEALKNEMEASARQGLLIFCDDADDLNPALQGELQALLENFEHPVGVVFSGQAASLTQLQAPLQQVQLDALSLQGLQTWLHDVLRWDAPADFLQWFMQKTSGLPQKAEVLLQSLLQQNLLTYTGGHWVLSPEHRS